MFVFQAATVSYRGLQYIYIYISHVKYTSFSHVKYGVVETLPIKHGHFRYGLAAEARHGGTTHLEAGRVPYATQGSWDPNVLRDETRG